MSTVRDQDGNILNPRAPQTRRYTDETALVQDWNTLHPAKLTASVDGPVRVEDVVTGEKFQDGVKVNEFTVVVPESGTYPVAQPPYEDENGKTWLYNSATAEWDIPAEAEATNETPRSDNDVPQDGLSSGLSESGLAGTATDAVQEPAASSDSAAGDVPAADEGTEPSV